MLPRMLIVAGCLVPLPLAAEPAPDWTATSRFAPPEDAAPAPEGFSGRLSLATTELDVETTPPGEMIRTPWAWWGVFDFLAAQDPEGAAPLPSLDAQLFPGLEVTLFTTPEGDLVPLERGIVRRPLAERTESFWEIIAGPDRVWASTEPGRDGWTKAAFPFSLVQSQEGEAWIGLAAFHHRDGEVSPLRVQLSSVSGGGFIFWDADFDLTAWAEVPATFTPAEVPEAARAAFAAEKADRLPLRPLADLGAAGAVLADLPPDATLAAAALEDGTLFMDPVETPFGPHPYPQDMRVGVWSVTKSLVPGMAALRLAQKHGPEFLDTRIVDHFAEGEEFAYPGAAAKARWAEVTIRDALDMRTGMGAPGYEANWAMENLGTYRWSYSYALDDQIRAYFDVGPNPEVGGPGEAMAYIDQDMWIATLAMERFLQSKEGPEATILEMLRSEVYEPIGAHHFAAGTGYTETGEPGFPYSAWGALPTIDILARAGRLIADGGAAPDGTQILDRTLVERLSRSPDYALAFWKESVEIDSETHHIPQMRGAGGNTVLSLPNGTATVVLGRDSYDHEVPEERIRAAIAAADAARPF